MVERQLRRRGVDDRAVLEAMLHIPRHRFVSGMNQGLAYADRALPTAEGQTISQPYMVGLMTQLLCVQQGVHVLEIGTGSGYQSAILSQMGARVVSIEHNQHLAGFAARILDQLGYRDRIQIVIGDGTLGHENAAPYDRILVTAGAPYVPAAYRRQLVDGGRIVIPVGDRDHQRLTQVVKKGQDWIWLESVACRFVPLIGQDGWSPT